MSEREARVTQPTTEAGRRLAGLPLIDGDDAPLDLTDDILAIEREARADRPPEPPSPEERVQWFAVEMSCCAMDEGTAAFSEWAHADAFRHWWIENGPSVTHASEDPPQRAAVIRGDRGTLGDALRRIPDYVDGYNAGRADRPPEPPSLPKTRTALSLLNSMAHSGEMHSSESNAAVREAFEELNGALGASPPPPTLDPRIVAVIAAHDAAHGESCDCDIALALEPFDALLGASPPPPDLSELRAWLIEQAREAHYAADHPDGQPGDPGGYFDKGAAHMADATLTWLASQPPSTPREPE